MSARRREIAVFRALGASKKDILLMISFESLAISALGATIGLIIALLMAQVTAGYVYTSFGVLVEPSLRFADIILWMSVAAFGAIAGVIPAIEAYKTETAVQLTGNVS